MTVNVSWCQASELQGVVAHVVVTRGGTYVYDPSSNEIVRVQGAVGDVVQALQRPGDEAVEGRFDTLAAAWGEDAVTEAVDFLMWAKREGGLFLSMPTEFYIQDGEPRTPTILNLEITEGCNFRCGYCVFSDHYQAERSHSVNSLTVGDARRAVDMFLAGLTPSEDPLIIFSGGEALLATEVVLTTMEYARAVRSDTGFALATNGLALDVDTFLALAAFDVKIQISIDGPAPVHDRFRVDGTGKGTFDRVMGNLEKIEATMPGYLTSHMSVNIVVVDAACVDEVAAFMSSHPILKTLPMRIGLVSKEGLSDPLALLGGRGKIWEEDELDSHLTGCRGRLMDAVVAGDITGMPVESGLYDLGLNRLWWRDRTPIPSRFRISGPCEAGGRRIAVSAKGELRVCDRSGRLPVVGDLDGGTMSVPALDAMEADYLSTCEACKSCWALRFCSLCYLHIYTEYAGGPVDVSAKQPYCEHIKNRLSAAMSFMLETMERDPEAIARMFYGKNA